MSFQNIMLKKENQIAIITVNRPEVRNALDTKTRQEIIAAVEDVAKDENVRVVIFTGAGDKAFVSGADIKVFKELTAPTILEFSYTLGGMGMYRKIEQLDKPTIAAINGFALGGGCEMALVCDIRIASENAKFGQPEINIGIMPGAGGTQRLPRLIGIGKAKELCYTGDIIDAQEALRIGLVDRVVPPDKLQAAAMELAKKIASKSPLIIKYIKRAIDRSMRTDLDSGLAFEAQSLSTCFGTEDKNEGVNAFLEKRTPEFKGR
jgi:enoyl-CoA hydratase